MKNIIKNVLIIPVFVGILIFSTTSLSESGIFNSKFDSSSLAQINNLQKVNNRSAHFRTNSR